MTEARLAPSPAGTFAALTRAEFTAYTRSARTLLWTVLLPLLILVLGEVGVPAALRHTAAPVLQGSASAITAGIFALGLFGYATVLANYRDRGVFQRLRCSPAPTWQLLAARLLVQLVGVVAQAIIVFAAARAVYGFAPGWAGAGLAAAAVLVAGLAALAVGQVVAALARSAGSVTGVARVLLFAFFLLEGAFVSTQSWPAWLLHTANWTPVRMTLNLLTAGVVRQHWGAADDRYLLGLLAWVVVLGYVGLSRFRWDPE